MYHDFDGDGSGQYFGRSVDIDFSGTTFIGGAPSNTTGNYPEGYAMIYEWNGKTEAICNVCGHKVVRLFQMMQQRWG